jgi:hypothetical protein
MASKLRSFALALLAVLSMIGATSTVAQATPGVEVGESAILEGTASGGPLVWASGSRSVKCSEALLYNALAAGKTAELTVDPKEYPCKASFSGFEFPATYTSNHCEYTFQNMTTAGTSWTATMDILCENPGEEMEIHVYENELKHKEGKALCEVKIPPQQDRGTVVFSNMATSKPADITINMTLASMQFNISGPVLFCGTSSNNGTYTGVFTAHAKNLKGEAIPVTISP